MFMFVKINVLFVCLKEINNEKAQSHVRDIDMRLRGLVASKSRGFNIPLSVDGQVNLLIADAKSERNLCQMYIGWAPYY